MTTTSSISPLAETIFRGCALGRGASDSVLRTALTGSKVGVLPAAKASPIYQQGRGGEWVVVVWAGRIALHRQTTASPDRLLLLDHVGHGDVIGTEMICGDTYEETATVIEDAEVLWLRVEQVRSILDIDVSIARALRVHDQKRLRRAQDRIAMTVFRNIEARVADFLLRAAHRWGTEHEQGTKIAATFTHEEIALLVGSTRETVTLTLGGLKARRLLVTVGRALIVPDLRALEAVLSAAGS